MAGRILTRKVNCTDDHNEEEDYTCSLSIVGDKPLDSSATNAYSSSSNKRVNEMNLV